MNSHENAGSAPAKRVLQPCPCQSMAIRQLMILWRQHVREH